MKLRHAVVIPAVGLGSLFGCGGSSAPAASPSSDTNESGTSSASAESTESKSADSETAKPTADGAGGAAIATGLQTLERRSASLDFDLNLSKKGAGSGVQHGEWSFAEERTLRVKKAKDNKILELEVVYGKWEAKPLLGLTYEVPTNDKTYVVSLGDKLNIVHGGEKVSAAEEKAVSAEYGWVGTASPLAQALIDAKFKPETHLSSSPQISAALLGAIPGVDIAHAGIMATIKAVKAGARKTATLEVAGSFSIKTKKTVFDIELKGPAEVDVATGWVQSMDLQGTANVTGQTEVPKKGTMDVEGKGKVTISRHSEFK
jgi:hypothetical protein